MLTSAQIVTQALQIAKCPGYTVQATNALNALLNGLALTYDNTLTRKLTTIAVTSGTFSYPLPADYLRQKEVFYNISGTVFYLNQIALQDFDQQYTGSSNSQYPDSFATDNSNSTIYLYPYPGISFTLSVRYIASPADIANADTSTTVPWFPYQQYLIHALATQMMKLTDDERWASFESMGQDMLRDYLRMDNDMGGYVNTVKKDPRTFRNGGSYRPTKLQGW